MKTLNLEIKAVEGSEPGTFEGRLAVYSNVDQGGDLIEPGAFAKTLKEHPAGYPLLWSHDPRQPVGKFTAEDRSDGLHIKGKLLLKLAKASEVYELLREGVVHGLSIGYESVKAETKNGIRHLKELRLYEGSLVLFPMNPEAVVSHVKSDADKTSDELEAEIDSMLHSLRKIAS